MIRDFAALKLRLVVNGARRRGVLALVGVVLGLLLGVGVGVGVGVTGQVLQGDEDAVRALALSVSTGVFIAFTFAPLLFGIDETVDPARLALLPLTGRELGIGLAVAAAIGPAPAALAMIWTGLGVGLTPAPAYVPLTATAAAVGALLTFTSMRALSTALALAQRSRRGRDLSVLAAAGAGTALWLGSQFVGEIVEASSWLVVVVEWTPPGLVGAALADAADRAPGVAVARLVGAGAWAAAFGWVWLRGAVRLLVDPGRAGGSRASSGWEATVDRWSRGRELGVAVAKELRYLVRSPSRRAAALTGVVIGTGFVVVTFLRGYDLGERVVLMAPFAMFVALAPLQNQFGYDSGSLWLEVVAGGPRRTHVVARQIGWLPAVLAAPVVAAVLLAVISGGWGYLPYTLGLAVAASIVFAGVGSVVSVMNPMRVPESGSPFGNRDAMTGRGCAAGIGALLALLVDVLLLLPIAVAAGVVVAADLATAWLGLVVVAGTAWALAVWAFGMGLVERRLRGHEPELLVELTPRQ